MNNFKKTSVQVSQSAHNKFPRLRIMGGVRTLLLFIVIVAILLIGGYYAYTYYSSPLAQEKRAEKKVVALINDVSKLIILPEGVTPTIFDVKDSVELAKQQAFFAGSEVGDKLLFYPEPISKAILYSPRRHIIVNVGPVRTDEVISGLGNSTTVSKVLTVEVRNGGETAGAGKMAAENIDAFPDFRVTTITDAARSDYAKTIIAVSADKSLEAEVAGKLAEKLDGTVVTQLPEGEPETQSDILVIIGKN